MMSRSYCGIYPIFPGEDTSLINLSDVSVALSFLVVHIHWNVHMHMQHHPLTYIVLCCLMDAITHTRTHAPAHIHMHIHMCTYTQYHCTCEHVFGWALMTPVQWPWPIHTMYSRIYTPWHNIMNATKAYFLINKSYVCTITCYQYTTWKWVSAFMHFWMLSFTVCGLTLRLLSFTVCGLTLTLLSFTVCRLTLRLLSWQLMQLQGHGHNVRVISPYTYSQSWPRRCRIQDKSTATYTYFLPHLPNLLTHVSMRKHCDRGLNRRYTPFNESLYHDL